MGRYVKNPKNDNPGAVATEIVSVDTGTRPTGENGQIIYNTTLNKFQAYIQSQWYTMSTSEGTKTITIDKFQGDGSTTVFGNNSGNTLDGSTQANLSFSVADEEDIIVYVGGVYQIPDTNYTVSGNQITFGSAPPANDGASSDHIITIIHGLHKIGE